MRGDDRARIAAKALAASGAPEGVPHESAPGLVFEERAPQIDDMPDADKPQRLHKALAQTGLGSRRKMEALIAEGQVEINGEVATVGQTVTATDRVHVKRRKVNVKLTDDKPRVMIYHKPAGEIVSREDPEGRPTVFQSLKAPDHGKWVAVGRLDFNSEGLLLFTTYGELANRLMHPRYMIVREYSVRILGELTHEQEDQLIDGIELEDGPARVLSLEVEGGEGANRWYRLTLQEGRNREVRRLFEHLGITVSRLIRIKYGTLSLPSWLKRGQSKLLDEVETFALLESVGLRSNSPRAQMKRAMKNGGVVATQAPVGVMRNAREHELAREGRGAEDPATRTARGGGKKHGKPRIDALQTSFGFGNGGPRGPRGPRVGGGAGGARFGRGGAGGGAPSGFVGVMSSSSYGAGGDDRPASPGRGRNPRNPRGSGGNGNGNVYSPISVVIDGEVNGNVAPTPGAPGRRPGGPTGDRNRPRGNPRNANKGPRPPSALPADGQNMPRKRGRNKRSGHAGAQTGGLRVPVGAPRDDGDSES